MDFTTKIIDFGISKSKKSLEVYQTNNIGTAHWMAPEILERNDYSEKSDVYAFAIIMYEILFEKIPFSSVQNDKHLIYKKVLKGERPNNKEQI